MRPDLGLVPLEDLRADGVLLEINRRVLHPVGLAIGAVPNGAISIDRMAHPGQCGAFYGRADLGPKAAAFRAMEAAEHPARYAARGFIIEPIPGDPPRVIAADGLDGVSIWPFIEAVTAALVRALPLDGPTRDLVVDCVADVLPSAILAPLLDRLEMQSTDGGATWQWRIGPAPVVQDVGPVQRCLFLVEEIQRLQEGGEAHLGEPSAEIREYVSRARGQLYPEEVEELRAAAEVVHRLAGRTVSEDSAGDFAARLEQAHQILERLYANAQPGMRLLRGDDDAREAFEVHRIGLRDAARGAAARMTAYERLVSGELSDFEDAPWAELQTEVEQDLESATAACAEADRQMREATQAQERASRCLDVVRRALARGETP